jgi:hypothetical protein
MQIPENTREAIRHQGIRLKEYKTGEAAEVFNKLSKAGVNAAGAFHLTC